MEGKYREYHLPSLPKDKELQKQWIHVCRRKDSFNAAVGRVCSVHFEKDFQSKLNYDLLGMQ